MRRLYLAFLAGLHLGNARQQRFSIHDDLLAHPQFEVVFSDAYISEHDALALLQNAEAHPPHPTYAADFSQTDLASRVRESSTADAGRGGDGDGDGSTQDSETYEFINVPPSRYLCAIPVLAPPPAPNHTATELAKAEEARELGRASAKGWELMNGLEGQCLYYASGWWSYSFCYGKEIVQFHALPGGKGMPPTRDPGDQEYVLGRVHYDNSGSNYHHQPPRRGQAQGYAGHEEPPQHATHDAEGSPDAPPSAVQAPPHADLLVKDDQRYLVQRLDGGTVCDLTGRDRTIEVQYHCAPGAVADRIALIKEVTTCAYLMVVYTPRLCLDPAFLPPKDARAHPISCRYVVASHDDEARWRDMKTDEALDKMIGSAAAAGENLADLERQVSGATLDRLRAKAQKGHYAARTTRGDNGNKNSNNNNNNNNQYGASPDPHVGATVGGVVVGGRRILGPAGEGGKGAARLPPSRRYAPWGEPVVETLARGDSKAEGGGLEQLTDEELEQLELSPETVEKLRQELQRLAGDKGWKLEVVEIPGEAAEIRGIVDSDDDGEDGEGETPVGKGGSPDGKRGDAKGGHRGGQRAGKATGGTNRDGGRGAEQGGEGDQGSEETFFKEEL